MAEARVDVEWDHTSCILAQQANLHRDKKRRAVSPWDFHPHGARKRREERAALPKVKMRDVKDLLMGAKPRPPGKG